MDSLPLEERVSRLEALLTPNGERKDLPLPTLLLQYSLGMEAGDVLENVLLPWGIYKCGDFIRCSRSRARRGGSGVLVYIPDGLPPKDRFYRLSFSYRGMDVSCPLGTTDYEEAMQRADVILSIAGLRLENSPLEGSMEIGK